jgi:DNA invertase Pin-like site-specific DNA recombinase
MSRPTPPAGAPARLRCALYTRKSSEEGLEQDFNSLHAQREACEAYVRSQAGEGWVALASVYDDGGFSGGSMVRPGLAQLMTDVDAGRIDVVVVYKVDRLTRSLTDFARIVERFDAKGVSFVSVTQAFNTTTSMGRLTLNVLLSFAQFEREVTGERIRDKIAASKAKGMWMGGNLPLGYDADGRTLAINPAEADQVRHIFGRYLALGSVHALRDELEVGGLLSKRRLSANGKAYGGVPFSRGALFHLLSNRLYLGEIVHKQKSHAGLHVAIVDSHLFEAAQEALAKNAGAKRRAKAGLAPMDPAAPLTGIVFDDRGNPMSPVTVRKGETERYRYYVSAALLRGRRDLVGSVARFPAPALEGLLVDRVEKLELSASSGAEPTTLRDLIDRVEVGRHRVVVTIGAGATNGRGLADLASRLPAADHLEVEAGQARLTIAAVLHRRGGAKLILGPHGGPAVENPRVDPALLKALVRAESWKARLREGRCASILEIMRSDGFDRSYVQRLIRLAFLAPDLKRSILEGRAPQGLTLQRLMADGVSLPWCDQRRSVSSWRSGAGRPERNQSPSASPKSSSSRSAAGVLGPSLNSRAKLTATRAEEVQARN